MLAAAILCTGARAQAQSAACSSYSNVVYVGGSTAAQPVFQAIANTLGSAVSIVYLAPASCAGLNDIITGTKETSSASYLDPTQKKAVPCTLPTGPTGGALLDIGVSDVYPQTCVTNLAIQAPSASQKDFPGPVQVMTFAVPTASKANAISADAAYTVFGFDADPMLVVQPWSDPTSIFVRTNTSGTLNMLGTAIGLAANKWRNDVTPADAGAPPGQQKGGTPAMVTALTTATNADAAIGILAAQSIQFASSPVNLKILAYQHKDQSCGYLPDSDSTHFDKLNVRQGRYVVWGPVHIVTNVDGSGNPLNSASMPSAPLTTIMNYVIGTGPNATAPTQSGDAGLTDANRQTIIDAEAKAGVVPWCAMQVSRTSEIGPESSYSPAEPCGCHFESVVGSTVSTYCTSCNTDADCKTASYTHCRFGYCEAQ